MSENSTAERSPSRIATPDRGSQPPRDALHTQPFDRVIAALTSSTHGLSETEAQRRLAKHGPNRLPAAKPRSALARFLLQFHNLLIYVLIAAAVVAAALGHAIDAAVILAVVVVNSVVGYIQEGRAEQALDAIRNMILPHAAVIRDGHRITIDASDVVPGDIVLIEAGDRVPADLRLIRARNLKIDEAILTGESIASDKGIEPVDHAAALGDRTCMAYSGTFVAAGQGQGIATATGLNTELGRISEMLGTVETLTTPLVRQMDHFARQLTSTILFLSAAVFAIAVWLRDYPWGEAFMAIVGLAVAAIPEGLPAVMTITLAIGVQRMARRRAIIRRLPAVETLGSVSVICSDKTGTFTRNEMTVQSAVTADGIVDVSGSGYEPRGSFMMDVREFEIDDTPAFAPFLLAALLCNDASLRRADNGWVVDGDPMEGALVSFALKGGLERERIAKQFPRSDEIPFDARHRFMATLHHGHDRTATIYLKGAPEQVIERCSAQQSAGGATSIDPAYWTSLIETLGAKGQRVLALAMKEMPTGTRELAFDDVQGSLVLLGLVGLIDPPREEAIAAVAECMSAGIQVKMITGDHAATAAAIASQLGLQHPDSVTTGDALEKLDDQDFRRAARDMTVFARTTPEHKLRLVEALQADGAVIAMTGDGVNDAPALKRADVGIAMGKKGTEAAKEAAEMVLADDNFASIVAAIREGRTVYDNLTKVIGWSLPTNGGEAMAIVTAILFGLALPITPVQILWINMVCAVGLGLTLAFEPTEPDAMRRAPRAPGQPILSGLLIWRVAFVSLLFVIGAFGMFFWARARGLSVEEARTIVVNTIVVMEISYLFSIRYLHTTSLTWKGFLGTPAILIGIAAVVAGQFVFTYAPFMQTLFATRPVSLADGLAIVGIGILLFVILELEKLARRRLHLLPG